ncbi:MAG: hypothetical protein P8100_12530, partial [bacterium]
MIFKKYFIYYLVIVFLSNAVILQSQTFEFEYSTSDDDCLKDVLQTEDGFYYLVGYSAHPGSDKHVGLVLKVNPHGKLIEERLVEIPNRTYEIFSIMQDTAGSIIIAGKTCDTSEAKVNVKLELRRLSYQLENLDSATYTLDSNRRFGGLGRHIDSNRISIIGSLYSDFAPIVRSFVFILNTSFDSLKFNHLENFESYQIQPLGDTAFWSVGFFAGSTYRMLNSMLESIQTDEVPFITSQCFGLKWDTDTSFYMAGWTHQKNIGIIRQFHPMESTGYLHNTWGNQDVWDFPA